MFRQPCSRAHTPIIGISVTTELKTSHLVLIGGMNVYNVGHMWLGHGLMERKYPFYVYGDDEWAFSPIYTYYEIDTYVLCNMGWNGYCDGYYLSASFDTNGGPDYQYNSTRSAISGQYNNYLSVVKGIRK